MKKALAIGINDYPGCPLSCCINDAEEIGGLLGRNGTGSVNFDVRIERNIDSTAKLRRKIRELFSGEGDSALLYFSGHGTKIDGDGGCIVAPDFSEGNEGVSFREILSMANESKFKNRIVLLDCCHAGNMLAVRPSDSGAPHIAPGVAVIAACRGAESAIEGNGHGVMTNLMIDALKGGAATLSGEVTPGGLYAYIDRSLGAWEQRPMFAANLDGLVNLRTCKATVSIDVLQRLPCYFRSPESEYRLDPSYECTNCEAKVPRVIEPIADESHIPILKDLQKMERVGLVVPVGVEHMYDAAMGSRSCRLTPLGQHIWNLVCKQRI